MIVHWLRATLYNFICPLWVPMTDQKIKDSLKEYYLNQEEFHQHSRKMQIESSEVLRQFARSAEESGGDHKEKLAVLREIAEALKGMKEIK